MFCSQSWRTQILVTTANSDRTSASCRKCYWYYCVIGCLLACLQSPTNAQLQTPDDVVTANLSAHEAYVGSPIAFRIVIHNGSVQSPPSAPRVDGLRFSDSPRPSRSHQMRVFNGRRTSSTTTTWEFQVVAERAGEFTIPATDVVVNNKTYRTQPLTFVATKSETGDLLLVEIDHGSEGEKTPKAYVGQAIKLKLKIWLRPFTDRQRNYKLNAQSMFNQISDKTSWGTFQETLEQAMDGKAELSATEVLRRDSEGSMRSYYLYEVETTVYPKRPGKIDVDDVHIVVDYPTGLGRSSRSRFGFFGPSLIDEMMGTTRMPSRPIVATASSPSIEILEVPLEGRPASYRGAVGKYRIVAEATPTEVNAGDSINLQIGLQGDGPMELVQAPPLSQMEELTRDFKVADDTLAGFVQGNGKLFTTTLRPLREGITSIPPIPFCYFDPNTEKFETSYTAPIPLKVSAANKLSMDEIIGGSSSPGSGPSSAETADENAKQQAAQTPLFISQNYSAERIVGSLPRRGLSWFVWGLPPAVVGLLWLVREGPSTFHRLRGEPGLLQETMTAVRKANTHSELSEALREYWGLSDQESSASEEVATESKRLRELMQRCERSAFSPGMREPLNELRASVLAELRKLQ